MHFKRLHIASELLFKFKSFHLVVSFTDQTLYLLIMLQDQRLLGRRGRPKRDCGCFFLDYRSVWVVVSWADLCTGAEQKVGTEIMVGDLSRNSHSSKVHLVYVEFASPGAKL